MTYHYRSVAQELVRQSFFHAQDVRTIIIKITPLLAGHARILFRIVIAPAYGMVLLLFV